MRISILFIFLLFWSCNSLTVENNPGDLKQILEEFHNPASQKVLIASHRAANKKYPENSLAAIQYSIETSVDIVEIDIRTTKDGRLVLMHDENIDRTTNGEGKVSDVTYAELSKYKLDSKSGDTISHKIPLIEEALNLAKGKIMVDLDIKEVGIKPLVELVKKTGTEKQAIFFDGDFAVLDSVLIMDSTLLIMPRSHSFEETVQIIERYHPPVIHIDKDFYTEEVVKTIKESGARVWINALGVPDVKARIGFLGWGYSPLTKNGANIIQTDLPEKVDKFLRNNN
ncbi:MAG: glycerophosphodiester phosphodiesterase family protein [Bacteroidota bacterium]